MSATDRIATSPPEAGGSHARPHRLRWVALVVVMTANVMDAMDSTIANIAGPSVRRRVSAS